jgi:hypothetical protein
MELGIGVTSPGVRRNPLRPTRRRGATTGAMPPPAAPITEVDVKGILNNMAASVGQPLNWRSAIVDLLELLSR